MKSQYVFSEWRVGEIKRVLYSTHAVLINCVYKDRDKIDLLLRYIML